MVANPAHMPTEKTIPSFHASGLGNQEGLRITHPIATKAMRLIDATTSHSEVRGFSQAHAPVCMVNTLRFHAQNVQNKVTAVITIHMASGVPHHLSWIESPKKTYV